MSDSSDSERTAALVDAKALRQFIHDLRTPLSVICMGLEALKHARQDEQQFNELMRMIVSEGTERLKTMLDEFAAQDSRRDDH